MRSRSRAIALRCACALESLEAFSLIQVRQSVRGGFAATTACECLIRSPDTVKSMLEPARAGPRSTRNVSRRAARRKAAEMRVRIGSQGRGAAEAVAPSSRCRGIASNSPAAGSARAAARNSLRRPSCAALPAEHPAPRQAADFDEQLAAHRHRHFGSRRRRRRALVGGEIDQRDVGLVADRRDQRDHAFGGGANHDLLVERPEVLQRAAAARHDQHVGPRNPAALGQRVEAADRGGDLFGRAFALHPHRPHQHVARKAVFQPMQDVADHGAGRRSDDADHLRQPGQELLARFVEQAFGGELPLALLHQRHQRADAGGLERLDHDLVFRRARDRW